MCVCVCVCAFLSRKKAVKPVDVHQTKVQPQQMNASYLGRRLFVYVASARSFTAISISHNTVIEPHHSCRPRNLGRFNIWNSEKTYAYLQASIEVLSLDT